MAYDEGLAERVRTHLADEPGVSERKMFGGLCFLVNGNMACGVESERLMVRTGPDAFADALARPHAREMDFTGRSMKGFVYVEPEGYAEDDDLGEWVELGAAFARSLPAK